MLENYHIWLIIAVIIIIFYCCDPRKLIENAEGEPEVHGASDEDLIKGFASNLQTSSSIIVPVASVPKKDISAESEEGWYEYLFGDDENTESVEGEEQGWYEYLFGEEAFAGSRKENDVLLVNGTANPKFSRYIQDLRLGDIVNLFKLTSNLKFKGEFPIGHTTLTYHSCKDTNNDNWIDHRYECSVGKFKYLGSYRWELVKTAKRKINKDEYSGLIKATGSRLPKKKEEFGCSPCKARAIAANESLGNELIEKREQINDGLHNLRNQLASSSNLGKAQVAHSIQILSGQKAQIDHQLKKIGIDSFRAASENDIPPNIPALGGTKIRPRIPTYTKNGGLFIPRPGKASGGKVIGNVIRSRRTWDLFPESEFGSKKKADRRQCPFSKDSTFDYRCGQLWHGATWNIPRTWTFDDGSAYEFDGRIITELHA